MEIIWAKSLDIRSLQIPFFVYVGLFWYSFSRVQGNETLEVVSSLDLWDFEGAHVVSPIATDAGLMLVTSWEMEKSHRSQVVFFTNQW